MILLEITLIIGGVAALSLFLGWVTRFRAQHWIDHYSDTFGSDNIRATIRDEE